MATAIEVNTELTSAAEAFIRRFLRLAAGPKVGFRLKVTPGGCSGFATEFDLVDAAGTGDVVWEYQGLRIILATESCKILDGATVDFVETLAHNGFLITKNGVPPAACTPLSNLVSVESLMRR